MGEVELNKERGELLIRATLIFYGAAASEELAERLAVEVSDCWNAARGVVKVNGRLCQVRFEIAGMYQPALRPEEVMGNEDPRNNYFRVEEVSRGGVSSVDGLHSNTGYFKLDSLVAGSTTVAHEFGHTLGLDHPRVLDIRGQGVPGIMYPRGTICDPEFQYEAAAVPGAAGGTMHPRFRKVRQADIDGLRLSRLSFDRRGKAVVGDFSSVYHDVQAP